MVLDRDWSSSEHDKPPKPWKWSLVYGNKSFKEPRKQNKKHKQMQQDRFLKNFFQGKIQDCDLSKPGFGLLLLPNENDVGEYYQVEVLPSKEENCYFIKNPETGGYIYFRVKETAFHITEERLHAIVEYIKDVGKNAIPGIPVRGFPRKIQCVACGEYFWSMFPNTKRCPPCSENRQLWGSLTHDNNNHPPKYYRFPKGRNCGEKPRNQW
jgi:hypothetical protein